MWKDFKAFLLRGNVIDLATAVVIGAAFGKIVTALVDNIIMPCIGVLTSGVDFANMKYVIQEAKTSLDGTEIIKEEVAIGYGVLINAIIQFIIIAFCIFIVIRLMNKAKDKLAKKEEEEKEEETPKDIELLTEIRDLLKKENA
ncbi:MAG: large-conductance mechanosensitive channel protein MscL [Clostridiales bacterium]|nr:large-conductance mechanosensitive channel protein MscL [Clostridiales bacterium]